MGPEGTGRLARGVAALEPGPPGPPARGVELPRAEGPPVMGRRGVAAKAARPGRVARGAAEPEEEVEGLLHVGDAPVPMLCLGVAAPEESGLAEAKTSPTRGKVCHGEVALLKAEHGLELEEALALRKLNLDAPSPPMLALHALGALVLSALVLAALLGLPFAPLSAEPGRGGCPTRLAELAVPGLEEEAPPLTRAAAAASTASAPARSSSPPSLHSPPSSSGSVAKVPPQAGCRRPLATRSSLLALSQPTPAKRGQTASKKEA